jgi:hypothetical protein
MASHGPAGAGRSRQRRTERDRAGDQHDEAIIMICGSPGSHVAQLNPIRRMADLT